MLIRDIHQLIKHYGSRQKLASKLQIDASHISRLLTGEAISVKSALKIDHLSRGKIPAERLLHYCGKGELARLIKHVKHHNQQHVVTSSLTAYLVDMPLWSIQPHNPTSPLIKALKTVDMTDRPVLIDDHHRLLWEIDRQAVPSSAAHSVRALLINYPHLLTMHQPIQAPYALTRLERMAIGLALESRLSRQQTASRLTRAHRYHDNACPLRDTGHLRTDSHVAFLCGIGSKTTYHRIKYVLKQGHSTLVNALNNNALSIAQAAQIAQLPLDQQSQTLSHILTAYHSKQPATHR